MSKDLRVGSKHEYYCPNCKIWMDRSGFTEKFFGDYQEQLCNKCNFEVSHYLDPGVPNLTVEDFFMED